MKAKQTNTNHSPHIGSGTVSLQYQEPITLKILRKVTTLK